MFLGKDPADGSHTWSEDYIQMFIIQEARRAGYMVTAAMEQGKRSKGQGGRAKAMGMTAGVPDTFWWLPNGQIKLIELKTDKGALSPRQKEFHKTIKELGHSVYTVYAQTPMDGWNQVKEILDGK